MVAHVTAAMLYDLVTCPHRVTMDLFTDPALRDELNPFVQLLWEKGSLYEREVIDGYRFRSSTFPRTRATKRNGLRLKRCKMARL